MELFDGHVPNKTAPRLNQLGDSQSFSSLLNKSACTNIDTVDVLSNHLFEMLRIRFKKLRTFLDKFQSVSTGKSYCRRELAKEIKSMGFTKQNGCCSFCYRIYTIYKEPYNRGSR